MAASRPETRGTAPSASRLSAVRSLARPNVLSAVLLALLAAAPLCAQELARPRLEGRVSRGDSVVGSGTVVLHRVTPDTAGEIDSVRVSPQGSFAFDLPSVPDPGGRGEVYFSSIEYQGVLYFGPAVHTASQLDTVYLIQVHDTAVAPAGGADIPLEMRYLILEPNEGAWDVTDLFQLVHEGDRTLVASEGGVVWSYPLPEGASDFEAGGGDLAPGGLTFAEGAVNVSTPIPPGQRQYVIRYRLAGPLLDLPLPGRIEAMELLVPEPAPLLDVQGLAAAPPLAMEADVTYRRFTGTALQDARVRVTPGREPRRFPVQWLAVLLALLLAGAALWAVQRRPDPAPASAGLTNGEDTPGQQRERLLLEVAGLDERLEDEALEPPERAALSARRDALMEHLRRLG